MPKKSAKAKPRTLDDLMREIHDKSGKKADHRPGVVKALAWLRKNGSQIGAIVFCAIPKPGEQFDDEGDSALAAADNILPKEAGEREASRVSTIVTRGLVQKLTSVMN
jgi:hypothetical protein